MRKTRHYFILIVILAFGCNKTEDMDLPTVEERTAEAIDNLTDLLVAPSNGWKLSYRPTGSSGTFLILMDFSENGIVRLQSDLTANSGEFLDHEVAYRIDSGQGLELILETYGVFHYLFELQQSTFGGEFEFIFVDESNGDLQFSSKTDTNLGELTTLTFEPASSNDEALLSTENVSKLGEGIFQTKNLAGIGNSAFYNLYSPENNLTISFTLDLDRRLISIHGAALGETKESVLSLNTRAEINMLIPFSFSGGSVELEEPVSFSINGSSYSLNSIPIGDFSEATQVFCDGFNESSILFSGENSSELGDFNLTSSLFQTHSSIQTEDFFSGNYRVIYDENDESLSEQIESVFPNVAAFQWYNEVDLADGSTFNGMGFVTVDELNNADFYLRGFDVTKNGNFWSITYNDENSILPDDITQEESDSFNSLMDDIFSSGELYLLEYLSNDNLFGFHNACNGNKGFIVRAN